MAVATPGASELLTIFAWFAIAALAAVGGIYLLIAVRKWTQREQHAATFTIQDLREMRGRGQISEQEFGVMRAAILALHDVTRPKGPPERPAGKADAAPEDGPPSPT